MTTRILILFNLFSVLHCFEYKVNDTESKNSCRFAQLKCSYRTGCGSTLQSFIIECDGLIHNKTNICSEKCKNTLVGLTSTLEGQKLMTVSNFNFENFAWKIFILKQCDFQNPYFHSSNSKGLLISISF